MIANSLYENFLRKVFFHRHYISNNAKRISENESANEWNQWTQFTKYPPIPQFCLIRPFPPTFLVAIVISPWPDFPRQLLRCNVEKTAEEVTTGSFLAIRPRNMKGPAIDIRMERRAWFLPLSSSIVRETGGCVTSWPVWHTLPRTSRKHRTVRARQSTL